MKLFNKIYQSPVSGAVGMGLVWALGWGLGYGGVMEAFVDPKGEIVDIWPMALGIPGLLVGVIFFAVLRIAEDGAPLNELPLTRTGMWGAVSGLVVCVLVLSLFPELWPWTAELLGAAIGMGAITAVALAVLFWYATRNQLSANEGSKG